MNHNSVGKIYPTFKYEVGLEKIFEYARATLSTNPYCTDPEYATQSHYGTVVAPPLLHRPIAIRLCVMYLRIKS